MGAGNGARGIGVREYEGRGRRISVAYGTRGEGEKSGRWGREGDRVRKRKRGGKKGRCIGWGREGEGDGEME